MIRAVLKSVLDKLVPRHGGRLESLERSGGFFADGRIHWANGVFGPKFDSNIGKSLSTKHCGGDVVEAQPGFVTRDLRVYADRVPPRVAFPARQATC